MSDYVHIPMDCSPADSVRPIALTAGDSSPFRIRSLFKRLLHGAESGSLEYRLKQEGFSSLEELRQAAEREEASQSLPSTTDASSRKALLLDLLAQAEREEQAAFARERERLMREIEANPAAVLATEEQMISLLASPTFDFDQSSPSIEERYIVQSLTMNTRLRTRQAALVRVEARLEELRAKLSGMT